MSYQIESIRHEEYNHIARNYFKQGIVFELHEELNILGFDLQQRKSSYDQNLVMIFRLIDSISAPILIFNQANQLTHANQAFSQVYARPWSTARYWQAQRLGLEHDEKGWHIKDKELQQRWQIRNSLLVNGDIHYQLMIFTDIQATVRQTRLRSWQEIVRVLRHEIGNSMAPISSLAETLLDMERSEKSKTALRVIIERSAHLQDFVKNYSRITQALEIKKRWFPATDLTANIKQLFTDISFQISGSNISLFADPVLLEQVMINLVKNAKESSSDKFEITINFHRSIYEQEIRVLDCGHGIANDENIFVPFYSTKKNGEGIGLGLARQIIEEHGGHISLVNREDQKGAEAIIRLPLLDA
ncbi:ATP-binding protein [Paraglaciecola sp.]|uniref:sensor histidine kinase n=1 Tax=Paraglaciecola sp. TaxID=1920173 RepID=UPI0030F3D2AA